MIAPLGAIRSERSARSDPLGAIWLDRLASWFNRQPDKITLCNESPSTTRVLLVSMPRQGNSVTKPAVALD